MDVTPQEFLSQIYGDYLEEGLFGIFTLPGAQTKWFQTSEKAGEYAATQSSSKDTYFTLGIFGPGVKKKGSEADAIGLACLNVDVDIKDPIHQKDTLPSTEEEALELIEQGIPESPPTIIINSGHGLQAFWVFNEPWIFDSEEEKLEAKRLTKSFHHTMAFAASGKGGWSIDSTFNLDRVMRIAGTTNRKNKDDPRPVRLVKSGGPLYNPDSFDDVLTFVQDEGVLEAKRKSFANGDENPFNLTLVETAVPPEEKFDALMESEVEFRQLWNKQLDMQKKRKKKSKDGTLIGDCSLSSYDMSLANHAAIWTWTDQEIANLIIAFRRKHMTKQADLKKALRPKYISDLIIKARDIVIKKRNDEGLDNLCAKIKARQMNPDSEPLPPDEMAREVEEAKVKIAAALQIRVERINKYLSDPPYYELILGTGHKVPVGGASQLLNQGNLRVKVFEATNLSFEAQDKKNWGNVITAIGNLIHEIETSEDTRDEDAMRAWIKEYLEEAGVWSDPSDAEADKRPFTADGRTYLFGKKLMTNINLKGEKYTIKTLGNVMARLGCESKPFNFKDDNDKWFTRRVYDVTPALKEKK